MGSLDDMLSAKREEILQSVSEYHALQARNGPLVPKPFVKYVWRTWDEAELLAAVYTLLDNKLVHGALARKFEKEFAKAVGRTHGIFVNSGSSANLVAVSSLTSKTTLGRDMRPLERGDEVITPAATFPTTLAPLVQNGLKPVFVDVDIGTYNMNLERIAEAVNPKTRLIMLPHTLGNPNNMDVIMGIAKENGIYVIEDSCDALGSEYKGKPMGSFGDLATFSFYLSHHISTAEGGMAVTNNGSLKRTAESLRDWGRDCWCPPMEANTCGKRFGFKLGDLPEGYDHKYTFSNVGYNLKALELQAAIGLVQLKKLPWITKKRRENYAKIVDHLRAYEGDLVLPESIEGANPSWFCIPLTVRDGSRYTRKELVGHLTEDSIETRNIFAGNILRQPGYVGIDRRVVGDLRNTDKVMNDTFFIGCHPMLTDQMIEHVAKSFDSYFSGRSR